MFAKRQPEDRRRVLVVGQVPPPWGGQAVMIKKLLDAKLHGVELFFVPMSFSADMDEIGRFRWKKLLQLPLLVFRIWAARFKYGCKVFYYPPGGESLTAIFRDIMVLLSCRILFKKVVFHIHAGGFTEVAEKAPLPIRLLAGCAYRKPDLAIQLTEKSPPDALRIGAQKTVFVPNGLADEGISYIDEFRHVSTDRPLTLLFVGVVSPSKGVMVLLNACAQLLADGVEFHLGVMGRFYSPEFEAECRSFIHYHELDGHVEFLGVLTGGDKWTEFCAADVFCFPSHFESENQSLVILEAMQFCLPCVASDWRGMSAMIKDGQTGFLVPVKDPYSFAERIAKLATDPVLRMQMGKRAREVYLEKYTDEIWRQNMETTLREL
ncbi:glycosyltransferase family 4 protein [Tichowtungia aerotolerans]|uniref:Glycosyltransferase n=1 Tax=Tichowtungia aerotolerans TaxID=2697043 RepID=A0A6P1MGI3_9BACT|nr:glycosyltransferase family 4 protein [Tichowtungia aerotolerans]QHI70195.1 glycosyltransferase [Tichowtungia aerotolerans]